MATQSQSSTRKSNTFRRLKQYRCQGFGDCEMVFSRSEHLARHIRKHTGEKPFKCESPDCNKSFSRFDNMRQHAQTHLRFRKHNCKRPDGVQIQPRLSDSSQPITLGDGQALSQKSILLSATKQGDCAQASVAKNQTTLGCGGHDNTTGTDSSPALPYYSSTSNNSQNGLVSPVSMSGTFDEQQHQYCKQEAPCCKQDLDSLTQDELDALDGLNQFQQSPLATSGTTTEVMVKAESN